MGYLRCGKRGTHRVQVMHYARGEREWRKTGVEGEAGGGGGRGEEEEEREKRQKGEKRKRKNKRRRKRKRKTERSLGANRVEGSL